MEYTPRIGSLAARVCAWLLTRPGAEIDSERVSHVFGATPANVAAQLGAAEDADFLVSERRGRMNVYTAGPRLAKWTPSRDDAAAAAAGSGTTPPPPTAKKVKRGARRTFCSPADLVIEDNVPLLPAMGGKGSGGQFDSFFAAMTVGQSFARPHEEAKALKDSADRWSKRHTHGATRFALRQIDDTNSRVWRTE